MKRLPIFLCAALATLACAATPALAKQARVFTGSFGGVSSTTPASPQDALVAGDPWSVAVDDATGDVYATDALDNRVEEFSASGQFILMFGKEVNKTKVLLGGMATEAEKNVCTAGEVEMGAECQAGTPGSTPGAFEGSSGVVFVAVDNSSGGKGDVYVGTLVEGGSAGNVVQKFTSEGELEEASWGVKGQLDGSTATGPVKGPFGAMDGIAVDPSGNLWVSTEDAAFEFEQDSTFITDWSHLGTSPFGIAVDSEDNLYLAGAKGVFKFNSVGTQLAELEVAGNLTNAVAVDLSDDDVYVQEETSSELEPLQRYEPSCQGECAPAQELTSAHLQYSHGLAVGAGASDTIYAAEPNLGEVAGFSSVTVPDVVTVKASGFTLGSAVLNGTVNPAGVPVTECFFEWGKTEAYGNLAKCEDPDGGEVGEGTAGVPVHAEIHNLVQGKSYHFRLVAVNANDVHEPSQSEGLDVGFGPPRLESESVSEVESSSGALEAEVDPDSVDTHVLFEYGTEAGVYPHISAGVDVGSGEVAVKVAPDRLQGLTPDTVYHFRVVVESPLGTIEGEDHMFTTERATVAGEAVLADRRTWELVTPPDKHGAGIFPIEASSEFAIQAAAGGGAFTYLTTSPIESEPGGNSNESQVLATRAGAGSGWQSRDISSPHDEATGISFVPQEYLVFSTDLSLGLLHPFGRLEPALSAEASEQTPFLHTDFPSGDPGDLCASSCYRPLVTGCPEAGEFCPRTVREHADVPPGTEFASEQGVPPLDLGTCTPGEKFCGPEVSGGSPDLSHLVLSSKVPLEEGAPENSLYEWSAGHLSLVSVLPGGVPAGTSSNLSLGQPGFRQRGTGATVRHAVSADGNRVFWSTWNEVGGQIFSTLYMRDMAREETILIGSDFEDANAAGSRVFFDHQMCEVTLNEKVSPSKLECPPEPVGGVVLLGASEDGSYVYFAAAVQSATPSECFSATPQHASDLEAETCDLYVRHAGVTKLIAGEVGGLGTGSEFSTEGPWRVSPDGQWLAFSSDKSLTGYDNHDASTGKPDEEVFLYGAASGKLVCASCNPTGARPHAIEYGNSEANLPLAGVEGEGWSSSQGIAASLPIGMSHFYESRNLSDGGRLFFDSTDALVPQDTNETEDVYEYEPPAGPAGAEFEPGAGAPPPNDTCTTASSTYSPPRSYRVEGREAEQPGGCISLISSGTSPSESAFLDASENGDEVFFLTAAQLSPRDKDTSLDVYDARAGGAEGEPVKPVECQGDACQSTVQPPEAVTPGSLAYRGPGNPAPPGGGAPNPAKPKTAAQIRAEKLTKALKVCKRDRRKSKRQNCEKQAKSKYGAPKKAKKAGANRSAKS